ncbi:GNAT family N-acetyltransferase [Cohnella suwonensis]|uniref:GNAT family N-acetyltransferase n=1 Tax=Cohnella suwonensis TaxID=696072 RepID=A0ABW0M1S6_9BACL
MTVQIRPVVFEDSKYVQEYASDYRISQTSNVPYPYPEGGGESWARMVISRREQGISFVFSIYEDDHFAGVISLNGINNEERSVELDYWIAVPYWNKGIGTEAAKKAIKYAFEEMNLETIRSACLAKNKGSTKVLDKNGFTRINEFIFEDGKFKDEVGYRYQLNKSIGA